MRDVKAPDGVIYYGDRLVRKGGKVKFGGGWYQHPRLEKYVGQTIGVRKQDYWFTAIELYFPSYPGGEYLFEIKS